jgi:RNA polymerase sigma factor (TIGR02999 family)
MESGEAGAAEDLLPLVYDELRRLAASRMAQEKPGQTLQATALVHEAWLKLMGENHTWESRRHFIRAAAEAMRRILVDRAPQRLSQKRSGQLQRIPIEDIDVAMEADEDLVLRVHEALEELAVARPDQAELVKLRFFVGMRIPDAAENLGLSPTAAKRMWILARAWLLNRLSTG